MPPRVSSSRKKLLLESAASTALVLALLAATAWIPIDLGFLNPVREVLQDFSYTDLYYSDLRQQQATPTRRDSVDKDILLINIGAHSMQGRAELAAVLQALRPLQPKVVGLDAYFLPRADSANAALAAAMHQLPQLVTGAFLAHTPHGLRPSPTDASLRPGTLGFLNFSGSDSLNATIRQFRPFIHGADTVYVSWSAQLVKRYDTAAYAALRKRHPASAPEPEDIRYQGGIQSFRHFEAAELLAGLVPAAEVRGKIVLLGAMGEQAGEPSNYEDLFFTPLNKKQLGRSRPDMYGVVIEANIVSMLLHQHYVTSTSAVFDWVLAAGLCYLLIVLFSYIAERWPLWHLLATRLIQFGLLVLLVYVVQKGYADHGYLIGITLSLAAVTLTGDAMALFDALRKSTHHHWPKIRKHTYFRRLRRKLWPARKKTSRSL